MNYKKTSSITIPENRGEAIGDWLIARFLEFFGTDELIEEYLTSGRRQFDKRKYVDIATGLQPNGLRDGVISIVDYQEFLDNLREILPKKYRKIGGAGKPGFDNVMPMVDLGMGPLTFEAAELHAKGVFEKEEELKNNKTND